MKLRMFVLIESWTSLELGYVASKSRSPGQVVEKPCVCWLKHFLLFQLCFQKSETTFLSNTHETRMFVSIKCQTSVKMGHVGSKARTKACVRSRGHIFSLILMQLGQNVCLSEILDEIENESCRVQR